MMKLMPPWYTFHKKFKALFENDPDINVGDVREGNETNYAFDVEIRNHEKFIALDRVLPRVKTFGNVALEIVLYDVENNADDFTDRIELYRTIFKGNPIIKDVKEVKDFTGTPVGFVRFQPEVVQFFDDNIGDFEGLWSGLAQDIAKEVFDQETVGIHFCTAAAEK